MSAYGEFTTVMSEEKYLVEGLRAMGYRVEVHARAPRSSATTATSGGKRPTSLSGARSWIAPPTTLGSREGKTASTRRF